MTEEQKILIGLDELRIVMLNENSPTGARVCKEAYDYISNRLEKLVMPKIYGVVEWINEHPILDGMQAFKDKESALKYCKERLSGQVNKNIYVEHTIIEINFSE